MNRSAVPTAPAPIRSARLVACLACARLDGRACRVSGLVVAVAVGRAEASCPADPPLWGPTAPVTPSADSPPQATVLLSPEEYSRQRAAENCPHRDCTGC